MTTLPEQDPAPHEIKGYRSRNLKKWMLGSLLLAVTLFVCSVSVLLLLRHWFTSGFFEGYDPNLPLEVEIVESESKDPSHSREWLTLQVEPGFRAPAVFHYLADATAPAPCIVMLLWYRADIKYFEMAADLYLKEGFAVICPEGLGFRGTPYAPQKRGLARNIALLKGGRRTYLESRRIVDYLATRPEIDSSRIYMFGVSLGAIVGAPAMAKEPRYRAAIFGWGAGNLPAILKMYAERREAGLFYQTLSRVAGSFLEPVEPLEWIDKISPRPVLFQNARMDDVLPFESITSLHEKAGEPKTILWYDSAHEKTLVEETVRKAIDDHIYWLKALDMGVDRSPPSEI